MYDCGSGENLDWTLKIDLPMYPEFLLALVQKHSVNLKNSTVK